jgi:carboxyl-terminal processing protease
MLEDGIGYLQPEALTKGKTQEIAARIKSLEKSGAKKLVLDLRNVSDGDEAEGVSTANLFLNHGTITYLQGQKFPREAFNADPAKCLTTLPLAVLVNRGTAGAAEIVAAAVLENARGDVVGDKTFGDGSVQKTIDLPDGGEILLTQRKSHSGDRGDAECRDCGRSGQRSARRGRGAACRSRPGRQAQEHTG